jgi:hypothetical protein
MLLEGSQRHFADARHARGATRRIALAQGMSSLGVTSLGGTSLGVTSLGTALLRAVLLASLILASACEPPAPDRIEVVPRTRIKADRAGLEHRLKIDAFRGLAPFRGELPPVRWTSSDETVASVDGDGRVKAVGSGEATITAALFEGPREVTDSVEVSNVFVASVAVDGVFPASLRVRDGAVPIKVVVRDEKGRTVPSPSLRYETTGPCMEARRDGLIFPMEPGSCSVVVKSADAWVKVDVVVKP